MTISDARTAREGVREEAEPRGSVAGDGEIEMTDEEHEGSRVDSTSGSSQHIDAGHTEVVPSTGSDHQKRRRRRGVTQSGRLLALAHKWRLQHEPSDVVRDAIQQCADELEVAVTQGVRPLVAASDLSALVQVDQVETFERLHAEIDRLLQRLQSRRAAIVAINPSWTK